MSSVLRFLFGLGVLLVYLYAGNLIVAWLGIPVPGSVIGMVLLAASLRGKLLRLEVVEPAAGVLLRYLALLFVPPGVGLMLYFDLLAAEWLPIVAGGVAGTVAVLLVVGGLQQRSARHV